MTLQESIEMLWRLYGPRNARYLPEVSQRVAMLGARIRKLEDYCEEEKGKLRLGERLASVFAHWCAVAETVKDLDVVGIMAQKYGAACAYCSHLPCDCPRVNRPPPREVTVDRNAWSLGDWQHHLSELYGANNRRRGLYFLLTRLFSEYVEVSNAWLSGTIHTSDIEMFRRERAKELCDVLAWTIAIASILEINLEEAVYTEYGGNCWSCGHTLCDCAHFDHRMSFLTK